MTQKIQKLKMQIVPILKKAGVVRSGIFGSFARGEETPESDLDILVEFKGSKSLFELMGLKLDLEEKIQRKVDIGTYKSIKPALKESILNEEEPIL
jgi:predicted nucleotidyltransferase